MSLPIGWEDRTNQMSEKDMALGGVAATRFSKARNAYSDDVGAKGQIQGYKTSDQVREFYRNQTKQDDDHNMSATTSISPPLGWENRQKSRDAQAAQMEAVETWKTAQKATTLNVKQAENATGTPSSVAVADTLTTTTGNEGLEGDHVSIAMVRLATQTLETLSLTLEERQQR